MSSPASAIVSCRAWTLWTLLAACSPTAGAAPDVGSLEPPIVSAVELPDPVLPGSPVRVVGAHLGNQPLDRIVLELDTGRRSTTLELAADPALPSDPSWRWFRMSAVSHGYLGGEGAFAATCTLRVLRTGAAPAQAKADCPLRLARDLSPELARDVEAEVFRDDRFVVDAADLPLPGEGSAVLEVTGTFEPEGGTAVPVSALLPFDVADVPARDRGVMIASSALGGIGPGTLEASMTLISTLGDGPPRRASSRRLALRFRWPEVHAVEPSSIGLGQLVTIRGGGLLASDDGTAGTRFDLAGTFTPEDGVPRPCCADSLLPVDGRGRETRIELAAAPSPDGRALVSELFGAARGTFEGTITAVTSSGAQRFDSVPVEVTLALGVRQVVYVHFVPAFDASLERFGLGTANPEVRAATLERMARIYDGYAVELRAEAPDDYAPRGYATLEIGGPDPNGVGLFGYDNTPGKDVGNLRLFDKIGGLNALTQREADGAPGFGGVFIDSFLYWSEDPALPGQRPAGAPLPEPDFDAVFGAVRARPASRAEVEGRGDPTRAAIVAEAVRVLGAIIGETAAHELGHSLGLAEPYGSPTVFHNLRPDEGCLMDEGSERPFAERAELPGTSPSRFCGDEPAYLESILGRF